MNIDILASFKDYTLIKDNVTKNIWLYSFCKPICYYDDNNKKIMITKELVTRTNKLHKNNFKNWLKDNLFLL